MVDTLKSLGLRKPRTPLRILPLLRFQSSLPCLSCLSTSLDLQLRYPFEEFMDHVRAMRTVRDWQETMRFGHLGTAQNSRANSARVLEYFSDSYPDQKEALYKAELFLSIYDYLGRNVDFFTRKQLVERLDNGSLSVDPALLRSVHYSFTLPARPEIIPPKKLLNLARAFQELETGD